MVHFSKFSIYYYLHPEVEHNMRTENDYNKSKILASRIPKISLGQEINTPLGKGIVVNSSMPSNGLYLSPERAEITVWYSTEQAKNGWVKQVYSIEELREYL